MMQTNFQIRVNSETQQVKNGLKVKQQSEIRKLCPCVYYWIALTTPNGAPCSPLVIHRALLECSVDVFANQVTILFQST